MGDGNFTRILNGEYMCMMDWRIGRLTRSLPVVQGNSGQAILLASNQQRVGVIFGLQETLDVASPDSVNILVDGLGQLVFQAAFSPFRISLMTHGDLPTRKLSISCQSGLLSIFAMEWIMPENYLASGLEQFESEYARVHNQFRT